MKDLKRNFGFIGRMFGIPRAWLSRVGAFCSSWTPEGNLIRLHIPDIPDPVTAPIKVGIDEDELAEFIKDHDREIFNGDQTLSNMITCQANATNDAHTISFYPPIFDKYGRYKGLSETAAWSVELLDNVL